jgi:hypothetical protein
MRYNTGGQQIMKTMLVTFGIFFALNSLGQPLEDDRHRPQFYDSTINGLRLRDPASIERIMGITDNIVDNETEQAEVVNESGNQLLTLIFHPGDVVNQFSEFKVEYNTGRKLPKLRINEKEFITDKGIRLGITKEQLLKVLGQPKEKKQGDCWMYYYTQGNGLLYFGNYYFEDGMLDGFWFGEEYP